MKAFVYVLALLFFTISSAEETSWTGNGANNTATNSDNWSNGVPTATSTVYLNDTTCSGTCTLSIDSDLTVFALYINGSTSNGGRIQVSGGAKLVVTDILSLGNPWTRADARIELIEASTLETGATSVTWIYPISYTNVIYGYDDTDNWFIAGGTVNVLGINSATSTDTVYIGSSSDILSIDSTADWIVTDGKVNLVFKDLGVHNIWGGSYQGSWISDTAVSISWTDSNVVLQDGAGGTQTRAAGSAVSFEYVYFYSSNSYYSSSSYLPYSLIFNTTGVTVNEAQFYSINIEFWYDGWLNACNLTQYALVNTTDGVTAHFTGENYFDYSYFIGSGTVQTDYESSVYLDESFTLEGTVIAVNNGSWYLQNSGYGIYIDKTAYFVNIGVVYVNEYVYIYGKTSSDTSVGDIVNMGTIVLGASITYTSTITTGTFRQCDHGILKYDFSVTDPSYSTVNEIILDGFIGAVYRDAFTFYLYGTEILNWRIPAKDVPTGSAKYIAKGPGLTGDLTQLVCFSKTDQTARVWNIKDLTTTGICDGSDSRFLNLGDGACSKLPQNIQDLEDLASCPAGQNCGLDTGAPSGEDGTGAANVNVASLAFIISLVCLLLKF